MPTPGEHKTVQSRILAYAEAIGWSVKHGAARSGQPKGQLNGYA